MKLFNKQAVEDKFGPLEKSSFTEELYFRTPYKISGVKSLTVKIAFQEVKEGVLLWKGFDVTQSSTNIPQEGKVYRAIQDDITNWLNRDDEITIPYFHDGHFYRSGKMTYVNITQRNRYSGAVVTPIVQSDKVKAIAAEFDYKGDRGDISKANKVFYYDEENEVILTNRSETPVDVKKLDQDEYHDDIPYQFFDENGYGYEVQLYLSYGAFKPLYVRRGKLITNTNKHSNDRHQYHVKGLIEDFPDIRNTRVIDGDREGLICYVMLDELRVMEIYHPIAYGPEEKEFESGDWVTWQGRLGQVCIFHAGYEEVGTHNVIEYFTGKLEHNVPDRLLEPATPPVEDWHSNRMVRIEIPLVSAIAYGYIVAERDDKYKVKLHVRDGHERVFVEYMNSGLNGMKFSDMDQNLRYTLFPDGWQFVYVYKDQAEEVPESEQARYEKFIEKGPSNAELAFRTTLSRWDFSNLYSDWLMFKVMECSSSYQWHDMILKLDDLQKNIRPSNSKDPYDHVKAFISELEREKKLMKLKNGM